MGRQFAAEMAAAASTQVAPECKVTLPQRPAYSLDMLLNMTDKH
jgi:hypothetical protein